jgi:hypothetical protein
VPRFQPLHQFNLYQCQDCGLVQLLDELKDFHHTHVYYTGTGAGANEHFKGLAERLVSVCGLTTGDMVIDVGSNDGNILGHFKRMGMEVIGFEPELILCDYSRSQGIQTIQKYFGKGFAITNPKGQGVKAKLITANNMFANLNDLDSFMEGVVELLDKDGSFVFESFYLASIFENRIFDYIYHEQPSAFSIKPVKVLMRRYGMSLYHAELSETRKGSMCFYCGYGKPEVEDDDPILYQRETYVALEKSLSEQRAKTRAHLARLKNEGKTICGFGATISATAIIYYFGLAEYIDFLVDDSPSKTGYFSPGLHLPIYPTRQSLAVDYTVNLVSRSLDSFMAAYPEAKIITPLPYFHAS